MLITHANLITWQKPNQVLTDHALLVAQGQIQDLGPQDDMQARYPQEERLDAEGQYVMPGSICAHTHFYGVFSRGIGIPGAAPANFMEILEKLWWPLDQSLDLESVRYSALVCLIDAIKSGTTTLIDHHASPNSIAGSLDVIASAVDEAGVRADLCYEVTDRGGEDKMRAGIAENVRFIERVQRERPAGGRLGAHFGLHASLTLSENTLQACREAIPGESGFHIHVAEDVADEYDSLAKCGMRVVDRLARYGILRPKTIVAHAVNVDAREIELLAENGAWVTHQPRSNMNNAVGVAPVESMLRQGIKVCIGNDGFTHDMWQEWKAAYFLHKAWHRDPRRMPGMDVVEMGAYHNAELASACFGATVGSIVPGAQADLIFVDYHPFTPLSPDNLPWHILFGFNERMVTATMVAGKLLMYKRNLLTLDEEKITRQAMVLAQKTLATYQTQS